MAVISGTDSAIQTLRPRGCGKRELCRGPLSESTRLITWFLVTVIVVDMWLSVHNHERFHLNFELSSLQTHRLRASTFNSRLPIRKISFCPTNSGHLTVFLRTYGLIAYRSYFVPELRRTKRGDESREGALGHAPFSSEAQVMFSESSSTLILVLMFSLQFIAPPFTSYLTHGFVYFSKAFSQPSDDGKMEVWHRRGVAPRSKTMGMRGKSLSYRKSRGGVLNPEARSQTYVQSYEPH